MAHFGVALANLRERDLGVFFVLCGAAGVIGCGRRIEDVLGEVQLCTMEPVWNAVHGQVRIDDFVVCARVDQSTAFPHVFPEISALRPDAPLI